MFSKRLRETEIDLVRDVLFIDTEAGVKKLVDYIIPGSPVYIDIEGHQLSRHGRISLMTLLASHLDMGLHSYIVDIHTLGPVAFTATSERGQSLKDILESPETLKVFYDVRNDSDALYAHYGIELQGVWDIQLMENARRTFTFERRYLSSLSKCLEERRFRDKEKKEEWKRSKDAGEALWNPQKGGSYSVFDERPLSDAIVKYCVGDVQYLEALYLKFCHDNNRWNDLVAKASQERVRASQSAEYQPLGPGRALSPWSAEENRLLDEWNTPPPKSDYFSYDSDRDWYPYDDNDFEDWTRADWQGPPS